MNNGSTELILQILMTLGIGGALAPLIAALSNRRKVKAESGHQDALATEVIAKAAGELAQNYQTMNAGILADLARARVEVAEVKAELRLSREEMAELTDRCKDLERKLDIAISMLERNGLDASTIRYT